MRLIETNLGLLAWSKKPILVNYADKILRKISNKNRAYQKGSNLRKQDSILDAILDGIDLRREILLETSYCKTNSIDSQGKRYVITYIGDEIELLGRGCSDIVKRIEKNIKIYTYDRN